MTRVYSGTLDGAIRPVGFKVVTADLRSLGLRGNPTIYTYTPGEWLVMPENQLVEGPQDFGGIWLYKRPGGARAGQRYMLDEHGVRTRIFLTYAADVLYENDDRFKTGGVLLGKDVTREMGILRKKCSVKGLGQYPIFPLFL